MRDLWKRVLVKRSKIDSIFLIKDQLNSSPTDPEGTAGIRCCYIPNNRKEETLHLK